jgi:1,4-alpha-glucan branching enzyme
MGQKEPGISLLTDDDLHLFNEGSHFHLYEKLGNHAVECKGKPGVYFAVWAPNAESVHVMGDFNQWSRSKHPLSPKGHSGIWEGFIAGIETGNCYKYYVQSKWNGYKVEKADPFASWHEIPPKTGSVIWGSEHEWKDQSWMEKRKNRTSHKAPVSVYEVHLGSWKRDPNDPSRLLSYRELAPMLVDYIKETGFTHVEFLPLMEHPFYGSWGYQLTGFFAASSRYGTPEDFAFLVDLLHQNDIGVILDWVPSHFPNDAHGLAYFDGTHLFEHEDPKQGFHPDWKSYIFNYGRHEVRSFLISSAFYWLDRFHIDGLRVDAVASMLYLDYSRQDGEWIPNQHGGNENLEAIEFLKRLNTEVYQHFPGVQMIAEESTAWPMVSRPLYLGGLGFGYKWDMGWMHDSLSYISHDAVYRKYHHHQLTFRGLYAFSENYMLPLSHDEVVHGKGSLVEKMPGDNWQKFANLRLLFANMFGQPAKKLVFMGGEFGQWREWNHDASLDWHLLDHAKHKGVKQWVRDLNLAYRRESALHAFDCDSGGFDWVDCDNADESIISWERTNPETGEIILVVLNYTPVVRETYRVGVKQGGFWSEILNSDAPDYGGTGVGNLGVVSTEDFGWHWRPYCLTIALPPLGAVFFKYEGKEKASAES